MRLLLRFVMSLLPIVLGLAFLYDVGGARTAFADRMPKPTATTLSPTSSEAAAVYRRTQETFNFEGRSYQLSTAVVDVKVLGKIVTGNGKGQGDGVTARSINGLSPKNALAVRIVAVPKGEKTPETWRLAVVPGNPSP